MPKLSEVTADPREVADRINDRKAAEVLHATVGELLRDEVAKLPSARSRLLFFQMLKESAEKNLPVPAAAKPSAEEPEQKRQTRPMATSAEEALSLVDEIEEMADSICENGQDFAESVLGRAKDIAESVERAGRATDGQLMALENMADGLMAWFHD